MIKKIVLDKADRLYHFPFDLEDFFPKRIRKSIDKRYPTIDLGRFRWPVIFDLSAGEPDSSELADADDLLELKETLAAWFRSRFGLRIIARKEIHIGQGIRRILFDICQAFVEYGDLVLTPEPGLPFYRRQVIAAGGVPVSYQISEKTEYKPSAKQLSSNLGKTAKIIILNNPHNPTGKLLDGTDLTELVRIASRENIFIVNDAAYCSLSEEKYYSILALPGGVKVGLELFSFPYCFGLPYMPLGFAVGSQDVINGLDTIGKSLGLAIPKGWIRSALKAIREYPSKDLENVKKRIGQSRLEAEHLVEKYGWELVRHKSSPFAWVKIPGRRQSTNLAGTLLKRKGILALPGNAFGDSAEGYFRLSLTAPPEDFRAAGDRLEKRLILIPKMGDK